MKRSTLLRLGLLIPVVGLAACASRQDGTGWVTLLDGDKGMENWSRLGDANWRAEGGAIVADQGKGGFLVSKNSYRDFAIYAEFWAATDTNSGIFIRASDPATITADNAYEVNIWDIRPDPTYGTGAIVNIAAVPVPIVHKAGGQWNTLEIQAKGDELIVKFNGAQTANVRHGKFSNGPFALQFGAGVKGVTGGPIKWRKVQIKSV